MAKIFDLDFRNGGYIDNISKTAGTLIGSGQISEGKKGKQLNCTGNTYIKTWDLGMFPSSGGFVAWFNMTKRISGNPDNQNLFSTDDEGLNNNFRIEAATATPTYLNFRFGNATLNKTLTLTTSFRLKNYYCAIITWQNNLVDAYFGGEGLLFKKVVDGSSFSGYFPTSFPDLVIGRGYDTLRYWIGNILKVQFLDNYITLAEANSEFALFSSSFPVKEVNRPFYTDKKITDLSKEEGLILAYNMKPINGKLPDISGNGRIGVVANLMSTKTGILNPRSSTSIEPIGYINTQHSTFYTTWSVSWRCNLYSSIGTKTLIGQGSLRNLQVFNDDFRFRAADASYGIFNYTVKFNRFVNYTVTSDGTNLKLYINGNYYSTVTPSNTEISFLYIITSDISNKRTSNGEWEDIRCYNRVLTTDEIRAYSDSFEERIYLQDNFDDDIAGQTISGWQIGSGSFKAGEESITETWVPTSIQNGGGSGTTDWTNPVSGVAQYWTVAIPGSTPQTGLRTWSVTTSTGFTGNVQRCQSNDILPTTLCSPPFTLEVGKTYRIRFKYKTTYSGIISTMYYYNGSNYVPINNLPITSLRTFATTTTATEVSWTFMLINSPGPYVLYWFYNGTYCNAGEYMEFDEVYIDEYKLIEIVLPPEINTSGFISQYKYIECVSPGSLSIQSKEAYGTWEFDFYKGTDLGQILVFFINSNRKLIDLSSGYILDINPAEYLRLLKNNIGSHLTLNRSANDSITIKTWYRIKITRDVFSKFYIYIKGGSYGNEYQILAVTTGTNPIIDSTYTNSQYFVIEMDAGDRFRALKKKGLETDNPNNELSAVLNLTF